MSDNKTPKHKDGQIPDNWDKGEEAWQELRELWDGTDTKAQIAEKLGINKFSLNNWRQKGYLPFRHNGPRTAKSVSKRRGGKKYSQQSRRDDTIMVEMSVKDFEKPKKKQRDELYAAAISRQVEFTHSIPNIDKLIDIPDFSKKPASDEAQVALFSDAHPGVVTKSFNSKVFQKRIETYTRKVIELGQIHSLRRPIRELHLFMIGDLVNGEKVNKNVNMDEFEFSVDVQIFEVFAPSVCKMLLTFANFYEHVYVHVVYGNHGSPAGRDSAYSTNWDIISMRHVSALLKDVPNLSFNIEAQSHYQIVDVQGYYFLLQHGDHIPSYLSTPIYGITNRALKMHAVESMKRELVTSIITAVREEGMTPEHAVNRLTSAPFSYFILGHFHHITNFEVGNLEIITNGTFKSDDQYVLKRMGLGTSPKQVTFGVTQKRGMTWFYKIHLDG
jgi:hypothetical protein